MDSLTHKARSGNLWGSLTATRVHVQVHQQVSFFPSSFPPTRFAAFSRSPCRSIDITLTVLITHSRYSLTHLTLQTGKMLVLSIFTVFFVLVVGAHCNVAVASTSNGVSVADSQPSVKQH